MFVGGSPIRYCRKSECQGEQKSREGAETYAGSSRVETTFQFAERIHSALQSAHRLCWHPGQCSISVVISPWTPQEWQNQIQIGGSSCPCCLLSLWILLIRSILDPYRGSWKTLNCFKSLEDDFLSKLKNLIANCIMSEPVLEP